MRATRVQRHHLGGSLHGNLNIMTWGAPMLQGIPTTNYLTEQINKYITPVLIPVKAASHRQEDDQSLTWEGGFSFRDAGSSALQPRLSGCRPSRRKWEQGSGKALLGTAF